MRNNWWNLVLSIQRRWLLGSSQHREHRFATSKLLLLRTANMKTILVYKGLGMYDKTSSVLLKSLTQLADMSQYNVEYVTPEQIIEGKLSDSIALLAIGGGYDLGLIKALGDTGMANIRDYVHAGGSYLGYCSGAYFACGRIEFDKGGPQEVVGDRYLKFFPGCGVGPLFKPYVYRSEKGAVASRISWEGAMLENWTNSTNLTEDGCPADRINGILKDKQDSEVKDDDDVGKVTNGHLDKSETDSTGGHIGANNQDCLSDSKDMDIKSLPNDSNDKVELNGVEKDISNGVDGSIHGHLENGHKQASCAVFFNGGCYFDVDGKDMANVTVISKYLDLPEEPAAIVKCKSKHGVAILCGPHPEYDVDDLDDDTEQEYVEKLIPVLRSSEPLKKIMMKRLLEHLNITVAKKSKIAHL